MHLFLVIIQVWLKVTIDRLIYHSDRLYVAIQQPASRYLHWPKGAYQWATKNNSGKGHIILYITIHKSPYNKILSQVSFNFNTHTKKDL